MARLTVQAVLSDRFTWVPTEKTIATEVSNLKGFNLFQPIYDDACDAGFAIISKRTGDRVTFCHSAENKSAEGALESWDFVPIPEDIRRHPHLKDVKVRIFND